MTAPRRKTLGDKFLEAAELAKAHANVIPMGERMLDASLAEIRALVAIDEAEGTVIRDEDGVIVGSLELDGSGFIYDDGGVWFFDESRSVDGELMFDREVASFLPDPPKRRRARVGRP